MSQDDKVECTVCRGIFSIGHGGKSEINQHIKTNRHMLTSNAKKSQKLSSFFSTKNFNNNKIIWPPPMKVFSHNIYVNIIIVLGRPYTISALIVNLYK